MDNKNLKNCLSLVFLYRIFFFEWAIILLIVCKQLFNKVIHG